MYGDLTAPPPSKKRIYRDQTGLDGSLGSCRSYRYESEGRRFESCRARHRNAAICTINVDYRGRRRPPPDHPQQRRRGALGGTAYGWGGGGRSGDAHCPSACGLGSDGSSAHSRESRDRSHEEGRTRLIGLLTGLPWSYLGYIAGMLIHARGTGAQVLMPMLMPTRATPDGTRRTSQPGK